MYALILSLLALLGSSAGPAPVSADDVLRQAKNHAYTRTCESDMPVDFLRQIARDNRPKERTQIDSHIEN